MHAILAAAHNAKYRTAFMLAYGSGLLTNEVRHLEPRHIDSERMVIRAERGKGRKDRNAVLSLRLIEELLRCWRSYRPERFLLEGRIPGQPLAPTSPQRGDALPAVEIGRVAAAPWPHREWCLVKKPSPRGTRSCHA